MFAQPMMMAPAPWQMCSLLDGPDNFNIVLNGGPACLCCGPTAIHPDCIRQRAPHNPMFNATGFLGAIERVIGSEMDGVQTVSFNTWVGGGLPPHMVGRVDPSAVTELVSMLSTVEQSQQNCLVQCFTCSCAANERNLEQGIVAVGNACAARLGSSSMQLMTYNYQYWVPEQRTQDSYTPGHWAQASLQYVQVNMPPRMNAPMMMQQQPMLVPGQPGYVQVNPMVMAPQ